MSTEQITTDLSANGFAQVIVYLNRQPGDDGTNQREERVRSRLQKHFGHYSRPRYDSSGRSPADESASALVDQRPVMYYYKHLDIVLGETDRKGVKDLLADKVNVAQVCGSPMLSLIRAFEIVPGEMTESHSWGITKLGIQDLWNGDPRLNGDGVLIGHLDTGADGNHQALQSAIKHFAVFDNEGIEVPPGNVAKDFDISGHGTHTAGTIAGRAFDDKHIGVAPGASLACAVIADGLDADNGDLVKRVVAGLNWAVGKGVRIINMSVGVTGLVPDFLTLIEELRNKHNVLPVIAVGNEKEGFSSSPGNYAEALSVGACNRGGRIPEFSSSQQIPREHDPLVPDLVAPGVKVFSSKRGGGVIAFSGTSQAAPHIAGLAALLLEAKPEAGVDDIERAILGSCVLPATMSKPRANFGLPNGPKALEVLMSGGAVH